jgi:SAM-dependent methyltransferase
MRPALDKLAAAALACLQNALLPGNQGLPDRAADAGAAQFHAARRIQNAYRSWLEISLQREKTDQECSANEEARGKQEQQHRRAFIEQTSYVLFARLLLARVLEDKAIGPGFASHDDFKCWLAALKAGSPDDAAASQGAASLPCIYRRIAEVYQHLFPQVVFDWFEPDDVLLDLILQRLHQFNFKEITCDLPGFIYEALLERAARNRKGHFLTPPEIVEFMLDRAGYSSQAIIGESLLDLSCGSGSFLVHAARRLRRELQSALAERSPVERAQRYIEQVRTKLVGLEINPFACYLARLNLFIQLLDDLALLWHEGKAPELERLAIYTTNSLEMPPAPLASDNPTGITETAVLDEAASVKTLRQTFRYILCNPPYINRGIVLQAQRYKEHPFYREVVRGDENFSVLFLRLATYYSARGGTLCFICPLNLLGDESTMRARAMFNCTENWRLRSITRFYSRTALFPGVLQGVCVVCIDHAPAQSTDTIEIRGGSSIPKAEQHAIQVAYTRVTQNYPVQANWSRPWLVHAQPEIYDLWEFVHRRSRQDLSDLIAGKLEVAKGDVRSTWSRPLLAPPSQGGCIPLTKGARIEDWGPWSAAAYLDPAASISPTVPNYKSCLWVQKQVQRIANLIHTETVLLLKEVAGLEMQRPIRGTLAWRSAARPFVTDETVLVMYTHDPLYETLACAVFGLLTSSLYNFLFSLFSTNAHANMKEILRLPVPVWSEELEQRLAASTRAIFSLSSEKYDQERQYGKILDRQRGKELAAKRQFLDKQVIEAYGIQRATWKRLIAEGMPWTRGSTIHNIQARDRT